MAKFAGAANLVACYRLAGRREPARTIGINNLSKE
jgi:hypothetical protein